jgi:RpiB/LacA/LacB family sugar-phosphate isomerase
MIVSIGCDHAGPALKARIVAHLEQQGHTLVNRGTDSTESVDYPDHAHAVAQDVGDEVARMGVLICGSANGVAMTANKHAGVRAAIAWNVEIAKLAREHNDANILCIPARFVTEDTAVAMVDAFVNTDFEGGRHARRVSKIACALLTVCMMISSPFWGQKLGKEHVGAYPEIFLTQLDTTQMKLHLSVLASDGFEGRETGQSGQKKAAMYLEAYYASLGFEGCNRGSFVQQVPLVDTQIRDGWMKVVGDTMKMVDDFLLYPGLDVLSLDEVPMWFVGYGIHQGRDWNNYKKFRKGGVVVLLEGEPTSDDGSSLLTDDGSPSEWGGSLSMKRELAADAGASAVIVCVPDEEFDMRKSRMRRWMLRRGTSLDQGREGEGSNIPTFFVRSSEVNGWLVESNATTLEEHAARARKGKPQSPVMLKNTFSMGIDQYRHAYQAENVMAFLEGRDPDLKDELIVITSHYDHVGITDGEVYNGADDDGSGTVTVMELARQFQMLADRGKAPRRSILFMNVVGEEKGLLGSQYYVENPVFPLENTVANLNIDMIGRTDENHTDNAEYVYLIGSDKLSTELHALSEEANRTSVQFELDYTFNDPDDPNRYYYRSDHYNFAKNNIPVIFYFTGVHEDYHQPGDDVDKIMFPKMAGIGKLVFHTAWALANQDKRIEVDVINDFPSDR